MMYFSSLVQLVNPFYLMAEVAGVPAGRSAALFLGGLAGALIAGVMVIGVTLLIFWITMLVTAVRRQYDNKAIWIALLLVGGWLAAIVFYVAVYRELKRNKPETPSAPSSFRG